jgi:hypothetical protein
MPCMTSTVMRHHVDTRASVRRADTASF